MASKLEPIDINRLCVAAQQSRYALRKPREVNYDIAVQHAGKHYSEEGTALPVPCNLIGMFTKITGRKLVSNNPRALLSTDKKEAVSVVQAMESWVNKQIVKIGLCETLQRSIFNSLSSIGIIKVGLADPGQAASNGWSLKAGEPFAEVIDLDDFVCDMKAKRFEQCQFLGHRYRIPLKVAKVMYPKAELSASENLIYNLEGDPRINLIGKTTLSGDEEFEDMIDLWEFYLPRHKLIVTLWDGDLTGAQSSDENALMGKALKIQEWIGPDCGPYHFLGMEQISGNLMPKAPLHDLYDLHVAINELLNKLIEQAKRQKEVIFVSGGADADGNRLLETNDGEATRVDDPERLKSVLWGGPNVANYNFMNALKELFSWLAGNMDLMGGLGPQSKTAKQDELLNENSSATIADMQQKAVKHAESVVRAMIWFWYHHPSAVLKSVYQMEGLPDVTAIQSIHPRGQGGLDSSGNPKITRDYAFDEMNIHVDPYSMQYQTPQQRMAALDQVLTTVLIPLAQLLQQNGMDIDIQAYLDKKAKLGDMPDLRDIVRMIMPPQMEGAMGGQGDAGAKPAETTRNYVRRSEGGATNRGKEIASGNAMMMDPENVGQPNGVRAA